jgi:hypothetical protein
MFVRAIDIADSFTRPIHIVTRNYGSTSPYAGAATLFFVNAEGWALTCRHVTQHIAATEHVNTQYAAFVRAMADGKGKVKEKVLRKQLEAQHGYTSASPVQILNMFVNCVDTLTTVDWKQHGEVDLALLKFNGFSKLAVTSFPVFAKDGPALKQGKTLCRLGFPFPEFTNFSYDSATDQLSWTNTGRQGTPRFPIEGMVTRHLLGSDGKTVGGFEMSTPGLRGQSGGPAFDVDGRVWGMQSATNHLDLDFDVHQDVIRNGGKKRVSDHAFLHVGHCVHVDVIKDFMRTHGVHFQEG